MFENLRRELGIDTYVSYNGQYVVLNGKVLYKNPLRTDAVEKLTEAALSHHYPVAYMDHKDMKTNIPEHPYVKESINTLKIDRYPSLDPEYYVGVNCTKRYCFVLRERKNNMRRLFRNLILSDGIRFQLMSSPKVGQKRRALKKLLKN